MTYFVGKLSIAPMLNWTDRHYRYMMRFITLNTTLYTEMITTKAILYGNTQKILEYSEKERPLALQLGGNNPEDLKICAKIGEDLGYNEINLNVGCPSDRVSQGKFGLSLMYNPNLVGECVNAIKSSVKIPVSIKCRTGVDNRDSFQTLVEFIKTVIEANVDYIFIHARKGLLNGLSPKENRTIPPLEYDKVYAIKQLFPENIIGINGGINNLLDIEKHLKKVDSVMIGRLAYQQPMLLKNVDHILYKVNKHYITPFDVAEQLIPYIDYEIREKRSKLHDITKHTINLFKGINGSKKFRNYLSEYSKLNKVSIFKEALLKVEN